MIQVIPVAGASGGECFLLLTERHSFLIDAGFAYCAGRTLANLQQALGGRPLDYILLTHSHYDHASGAPTIQRGYPAAKVVAAAHAQRIFEKEHARALMRELNHKAAENSGETMETDHIDELRADIAVAEGDLIRCDDVTIRVLETPGHTRCCLSYHFVEESFLATSETTGITPGLPQVIPLFIVGYQMALDAIAKCAALRPEHVLLPHTGLISGEDAETFFANARAAVVEAAGLVLEQHAAGKSLSEIVGAFREVAYPPAVQRLQPESAFLLNTEAMISFLIKEMEEHPIRNPRAG